MVAFEYGLARMHAPALDLLRRVPWQVRLAHTEPSANVAAGSFHQANG